MELVQDRIDAVTDEADNFIFADAENVVLQKRLLKFDDGVDFLPLSDCTVVADAVVIDAGKSSCVFAVRTPGSQWLDAGAFEKFDFSSLLVMTDGAVTAEYYSSVNPTDTPVYSAPLAWNDFLNETPAGRYVWLRITMTGAEGDAFDFLQSETEKSLQAEILPGDSALAFDELRTHLRWRLLTTPDFSSMLASPEGVYHRAPVMVMNIPLAVYELDRARDEETPPGVCDGIFRLRLVAGDALTLERMESAAHEALDCYSFETEKWEVARCVHESSKVREERQRLYSSQPLLMLTLEYALRLRAKSSHPATFDNVATTLNLPTPMTLTGSKQTNFQARGKSAAGQNYIYGSGLKTFSRTEKFMFLTTSERDALASFFDEVNGMKMSFTYTVGGVSYAARFLDNELAFISRKPELFDIELKLEVDKL